MVDMGRMLMALCGRQPVLSLLRQTLEISFRVLMEGFTNRQTHSRRNTTNVDNFQWDAPEVVIKDGPSVKRKITKEMRI